MTAITPLIIANALLLLAVLGVQGASANRYTRRKLNLSLFLVVASVGLIAAMYVPAFAKALAPLHDVPGLLFAAALINAIVTAALNPFRHDRISDRFPNIVQDALIVGLFFGITTLIFQETILTASAVSAVVVGFALQDTLGNAFAGLGIQIDKPFSVGHWIKVGDFEGRVSQVTWRATKLVTRAGTYVIVPNNIVSKEAIINYSEPVLPVRLFIDVGVSYSQPPSGTKAAILDALAHVPLVSKTRPSEIVLQDFAGSALLYRVYFWVDDFELEEQAPDQVRTAIYYVFHRRNIEIPYPIQVEYSRDEAPSTRLPAGEVEDLLRTVEIFAALGDEGRGTLAANSRDALYGDSEDIVRQGEPGASMFVIYEGEVRVTLDPGRHEVARMGPGGFFGEMSLLTGDPRAANVTAIGDVRLVEIAADSFRAIALAQPAVVDAVGLAVVARRAGLDKTRHEAAARASTLTEQSGTLIARIKRFLRLPA